MTTAFLLDIGQQTTSIDHYALCSLPFDELNHIVSGVSAKE